MADPKTIFLAPPCCVDGDTGRLWCEDNVWPCDDCPHGDRAIPATYEIVEPASIATKTEDE